MPRNWVSLAREAARAPPPPKLRYKLTGDLVPELTYVWLQLELDQETQEFLDNCTEGFFIPQLFADVMANILRNCCGWSLTDSNGATGRGQMFVLSQAQVSKLVRPGIALLDVGAGDGNTTKNLSPFFKEVSATELSDPMLRRLIARGYSTYKCGLLEGIEGPFDCISCLNVLDRCSKPITLMREMKTRLRLGGQILLAIVLPFCPFVEDGSRQKDPEELLEPDGVSFLAHLNWFGQWFIEQGWTVQRTARLPYLSAGDTNTPYYVLSDAIFVLTH